jgi:polyisoprenoid-binding protein YceI
MTATLTQLQAGIWTLDPTHTEVGFVARHLIAAKVRGRFASLDGQIVVGETPAESSVTVTIDAASIDTGVADRDSHLRSQDFLDTDTYPTITVTSRAVEDLGGGRFRMEADLTMRGVTKPVVLDFAYGGEINDPWGNAKAIFSAEATLNREDWGLTWNAPLEAGGLLVGKEIKLEIEAQAVKAA